MMRHLNVLYRAAASCMFLLSSPAHQSVLAGDEPASSQYREVVNALQTIKPVRLLTDLGQCSNEGAGKHGPSLKGGLSINTFIVLPGRGLFFSDVHQTLDEENQPVTEYVRYNLTTDDRLRVSLTRIVNSAVAKQDIIVCQMPLGARFVW
jgi:VirK protein